MNTIQDVIDKRNELFEKAMLNFSFMMVYNGDLMAEEEEEELMDKLHKLDAAINDYQNDECGCGQHMKLQILKDMVHEIEKYI